MINLLFLLSFSSLLEAFIKLPITANSQAFLESGFNKSADITIHAGNRSSCRFRTSVVPCECLMHISHYTLELDDQRKYEFDVGPPNVAIVVPSTHEMLQELRVFVNPKLCRPDNVTIRLEYRPFEVFPGEEDTWTSVTETQIVIQMKKVSVTFPCRHFIDPGYYRIAIDYSLTSHTQLSEKNIVVNETSQNSLMLREESIFPHCSSEFNVAWKLSQCRSENLHYRIRVLAVPGDTSIAKEDAIYIEEIGISQEQKALEISCSQFDIIFEKYCFELVSLNRNTSISHVWQSVCISTEPVETKRGGWSAWSEWSPCSETCGTGRQRRVRFCDEPVPKRAEYCDGPLIETQDCTMAECPAAMMPMEEASNCTCGCELTQKASSFFATPSLKTTCGKNQTWSIPAADGLKIIDFIVKKDGVHHHKLFFYLRRNYEELVWSSEGNQDHHFSLPASSDIFIVLWKSPTEQIAVNKNGFTVSYVVRDMEEIRPFAEVKTCQPFCPETMAVVGIAFLFLLVIFLPPIFCAMITSKHRRNDSPEVPLMDNKYDSDMIRSGNTESTQVSHRNYIAKRSIGIQLSVQSTPRAGRAAYAIDSPLPIRGQSSLSECDELEYDYYDGTTIPGSLLAPLRDVMCSQIDIDQIIGQSELLLAGNVETQDVHTQI